MGYALSEKQYALGMYIIRFAACVMPYFLTGIVLTVWGLCWYNLRLCSLDFFGQVCNLWIFFNIIFVKQCEGGSTKSLEWLTLHLGQSGELHSNVISMMKRNSCSKAGSGLLEHFRIRGCTFNWSVTPNPWDILRCFRTEQLCMLCTGDTKLQFVSVCLWGTSPFPPG